MEGEHNVNAYNTQHATHSANRLNERSPKRVRVRVKTGKSMLGLCCVVHWLG